jgi:hypothetical protein
MSESSSESNVSMSDRNDEKCSDTISIVDSEKEFSLAKLTQIWKIFFSFDKWQ